MNLEIGITEDLILMLLKCVYSGVVRKRQKEREKEREREIIQVDRKTDRDREKYYDYFRE